MNHYADIVDAALGGHDVGAWGRAGGACFTPKPRLTVSAWADRYRIVPAGTSPEPGAWRTDRVPYLRGVMDAVSDPSIERVVCMMASQVGKSSLLENVIGFFAHQDPAPILFVQPTEGSARAFSKERLEPTFRETPVLRGLFSDGERDKDSTILIKQFPGGMLACGWATSAVSLASRSIRVLLADELDRWVATTGADGDPFAQAVQRTATYGHRRKILAVSTPTLEKTSAIARLYDDSDQRRYHVPCPACGAYQVLEFEQLKYKRGDVVDLDDVRYECIHCAHEIRERDKPAMLSQGYWEASNPGALTAGFQLSSLYSPWTTWRELCVEWTRAVDDRDRRGMQEFANLRLGRPWREEVQRGVTVEALERNREEYEAQVPDGVLMLTAGVDVQDNRLELVVVGWGQHKEAWAIEYRIVPGSTDDLSPQGPWAQLDEYLSRTWAKADGSAMTVASALVDSLGHRTTEVLTWCRDARRFNRRIFPCHGSGAPGRPIVGAPTLNSLRSPHYLVGTSAAKETIYSRLALDTPGPGFVHFPTELERGFDGEYFKGLLSERLVVRKGKTIWERHHRRNEPLDTFVYALAALELLLVSYPWALDPSAALASQAQRPRRRVLSRGVE